MDETKELLSAILEGQQKLAAELAGFRAEMKTEIAEIRKDIAEIKEELGTVKSKVEDLDDNFDVLARRWLDTRVRVKKIEKKVKDNKEQG